MPVYGVPPRQPAPPLGRVETLVRALTQNQFSADEFQLILRRLSSDERSALFQLLDELAAGEATRMTG